MDFSDVDFSQNEQFFDENRRNYAVAPDSAPTTGRLKANSICHGFTIPDCSVQQETVRLNGELAQDAEQKRLAKSRELLELKAKIKLITASQQKFKSLQFSYSESGKCTMSMEDKKFYRSVKPKVSQMRDDLVLFEGELVKLQAAYLMAITNSNATQASLEAAEKKLLKQKRPKPILRAFMLGDGQISEQRPLSEVYRDLYHNFLKYRQFTVGRLFQLMDELEEALLYYWNHPHMDPDTKKLSSSELAEQMRMNLIQIRSVRRELETSIDGGGTKTWRVFHIGVAVLRGREGAKISTIIERMRCRDGEDDYVRIGNFMISRNKHRLKRRAEGILVMGLKDQPENMLPLLVDKSYTAGQRQNGKQQSHVNKTQNAPNSKKRKNNLQGNVAKKQNTNSVNPRNNQTQRDRNATPKGFIAGLSLKPLYPRDTTIPRTESWCSFHHHCDHQTRTCRDPNTRRTRYLTGLQNPAGVKGENEWAKIRDHWKPP